MSNPKTECKVLIISCAQGDTRRYRSVHLKEQCDLVNLPVLMVNIKDTGLHLLVKRTRFDIAIFQRVEMDGYINRMVKTLKSQGSLCLYDTDDLIFDEAMIKHIDNPDFNDPFTANLNRKYMRRQRSMLEACVGTLVSTPYLANQVGKLGKIVRVHPNAFSLQMLACANLAYESYQSHPGRVVIGYASGSRTHNRDFNQCATALRKLLEAYPHTELWLMGSLDSGEGWERFGERVRRIPAVDWRELPQYLVQFDINLAPLVLDNPFGLSKSAIKYMEAALVRRPTIASPNQAFKTAIQDGENGFLASNEEDWLEKLSRLVEDKSMRIHMGESAWLAVQANDHPAPRSIEFMNTLNSLSQEIRGEIFLPQVSPTLEEVMDRVVNLEKGCKDETSNDRIPSALKRGWTTLWRRGPFGLLGNIGVRLRRYNRENATKKS